MSYDQYEDSRALGQPVNLYLFDNVNGETFAYTDCERSVTTTGGVRYEPVPISRQNIVVTGGLDKNAVEISMPKGLGLPEALKAYPPDRVVAVRIHQAHMGDMTPFGSNEWGIATENTTLVWAGRILSGATGPDETTFTCESLQSSLQRVGLRRCNQFGCPHVLYGSHCRADRERASTDTGPFGTPIPVEAVSGSIITLADNWNTDFWTPLSPFAVDPPAQDKFIGGVAQWSIGPGNILRRTVLRILDAKRILVSGPATDLEVGSAQNFRMVLGCNRQMSDCENLHNNITRFGGQPWIPTANPFRAVDQYE